MFIYFATYCVYSTPQNTAPRVGVNLLLDVIVLE